MTNRANPDTSFLTSVGSDSASVSLKHTGSQINTDRTSCALRDTARDSTNLSDAISGLQESRRAGKSNQASAKHLPRILVVDDDRSVIAFAESALQGLAVVTGAGSVEEAQQALSEATFETALLDQILPDGTGTDIFNQIRGADEALPVILMTASPSSEQAIKATRAGMWDFICKPLAVESLQLLVANALRQRELAIRGVAISAVPTTDALEQEAFVGNSPAMIRVFKTIGRVSGENVPVLIRGESGTGKELAASALHRFSERSQNPFTAVNCAALAEGLLESELFGHEKGAFTGADQQRKGKFEQCCGGTLFLDEIGDMTLEIQAKVLRVLQQQKFHRVGGNVEIQSDVRILAATNRPLEQMVSEGSFREDLLYRLNGVTVNLPPLRERTSDIPALVRRFLTEARIDFRRSELQGMSQETLDLIMVYPWPGNVRQLRDVIREAVIQTSLTVVDPEALSIALHAKTTEVADAPIIPLKPKREGSQLPEIVDELMETKFGEVYAGAIQYAEKHVIVRALELTGGNQTHAAALLGIARSKIRDRIATYNIRIASQPEIGARRQHSEFFGG